MLTPTRAVVLLVVAAACARDRPMPRAPEPPPISEGAAITEPEPSAPATPPAPAPGSSVAPETSPPPASRIAGAPPAFLVDPGAEHPRSVQRAIAVLTPTAGHRVSGTVRFVETNQGLEVISDVQGLGTGARAYHVHVFGDCSAPDGTSAGPHFHFSGSAFDEEVPFITGDLGELDAARGSSQRAQLAGASLQGRFGILGRSVVVHAKGNDPEVTPDGGAGDRLACGVIGIAQVPVAHTARR